jgi:TATA-box binding protein (TBP) (component of TFIID and TFIIIB)
VQNISAKNVVITTNVQQKIQLQAMADENQNICTYDPLAFPGARLHPLKAEKKKTMALIFATGHVVIVGIKDRLSFEEFVDYFLNFIKKYLIP